MANYNYSRYSYLDNLDVATLMQIYNDLPLCELKTAVEYEIDSRREELNK